MPQWLINGLGIYGAFCTIVTMVIVLREFVQPRLRFNRGRSVRSRIASLRETVYSMESDVAFVRKQMTDGNDIMLQMVREMKKYAADIEQLKGWAKQVRTVTDLWEKKFKETGPDGP